LKSIIYALCLTLLLLGSASAKDPNIIEIEVMAKSSTSWDREDLPDYERGKPEITILKIVIPPGARIPLHKHPMINAGVLLKGSLTVTTEENQRLHLKAGDAIVEVVDKWHHGKNEGNEPAEIVVFYAGTVGEPLSIKE
jgi:quercetin dioxygenase-like cupin family protein